MCWLVAVGLILAFSQAKAIENRADRERQERWQRQMAADEAAARVELDRIAEQLRTLHARPDRRQAIEREFLAGKSFSVEQNGVNETIRWTHPQYGINVELTFHGNELVGQGMNWATSELEAIHPRPANVSMDSRLEWIRRRVPGPASLAWLACLAIALASGRWGRAAGEGMVVLSLLAGAAWLVDPLYPLTWQGVTSNDSLFMATAMYLASILVLAWRQPPKPSGVRFNLAAVFAVVTVLAVLLALGRLGYVAIAVFAVGAAAYGAIVAGKGRLAAAGAGAGERD